jgi:hypothetical protein
VRRDALARAFFGVLLFVVALSCDPIAPRPLSNAPTNVCPDHPCENYEPGPHTAALCRVGRCEITTPGSRPEFPFWIVVDVPDSAIYGPGSTYVLYSNERGEPAFKKSPTPGVVRLCTPPQCLQIGQLSSVIGSYEVTKQASIDVGYPLAEGTSIPVRVVHEPTGNEQQDTFPQLPLDVLFSSSEIVPTETAARYSRALLFGTYLRVLYPEPPFDQYFPPTADTQKLLGANVTDRFVLGAKPPIGKELDDVTSDTRIVVVTRPDGLDGWRVWFADHPSQRRISVLKPLSGVSATVRLDTTGEHRGPNNGIDLGSDVDAIVAPPDSWTAVPRLVATLINGAGRTLPYPPIPPPVTVGGVVALPSDGGTLYGYPARITFDSQTIATRGDPTPLLRYSTTMNTDDRGRFATVLPPGVYAATVEPAAGTGLAKTRQIVSVDRTVTALTLTPPPQTIVRGRALLTDDRVLSEADVVALPDTPADPESVKPRPGRTTTGADGRFVLELDPGPYVFTVIPKAGTGFPRLVTPRQVPSEPTELPDLRVPAPTRLSFNLRDPSPTGNPIGRAIVRIFADAPGRQGPPVEIGNAMSDPNGQVEILLAQEPR